MEMIRCPKCRRFFRRKDYVNLDICNTVIHAHCVDEQSSFMIKDAGTYARILNKYPFLLAEYEDYELD